MQRNPDLLRALLFAIETTPANRDVGTPAAEGHGEDEILEHLEMLSDAGLIEAKFVRAGSGRTRLLHVHVVRLTHASHEFIAKSRSDTVRQKTKGNFAEKGMSVSMDLVTGVLGKIAAQAMGIP